MRRLLLSLLATLAFLSGCMEYTLTNLDSQEEYKFLIGKNFSISDGVSIYGVQTNAQIKDSIEYYVMLAKIEISGPEIRSKSSIENGSKFEVKHVYRDNVPFENSIVLVGRLQGAGLSANDEVKLTLSQENKGPNNMPNFKYFKEITIDKKSAK